MFGLVSWFKDVKHDFRNETDFLFKSFLSYHGQWRGEVDYFIEQINVVDEPPTNTNTHWLPLALFDNFFQRK